MDLEVIVMARSTKIQKPTKPAPPSAPSTGASATGMSPKEEKFFRWLTTARNLPISWDEEPPPKDSSRRAPQKR